MQHKPISSLREKPGSARYIATMRTRVLSAAAGILAATGPTGSQEQERSTESHQGPNASYEGPEILGDTVKTTLYPWKDVDDYLLIDRLLKTNCVLINPLDDDTREALSRTILAGQHFTLSLDRPASKTSLKIGDVVTLKTGGGPKMIISYIYGDDSVCPGSADLTWFEIVGGSWKMQKASAPLAGLAEEK